MNLLEPSLAALDRARSQGFQAGLVWGFVAACVVCVLVYGLYRRSDP